MVQMKYGAAPEVEVRGDAAAVFPYIAEPLEYVLGELLKNAMRATVEHHLPARPEARTPDAPLPPVVASVHLNDREFYIRCAHATTAAASTSSSSSLPFLLRITDMRLPTFSSTDILIILLLHIHVLAISVSEM